MQWTDDDLTAALALYEGELVAAHLRPMSVRSFVDYGRRFLRWRVGDYRPRNAAGPARARWIGTVDAVGLDAELVGYERELRAAGLRDAAVDTYLGQARYFVRWLEGAYAPRTNAGGTTRGSATAPASASSTSKDRRAGQCGGSLDAARLTLKNLIAQWRSTGNPPQPGIDWSVSRWRVGLPEHSDLFGSLASPLDREAVREVCAEAAVNAKSAERAFVAAMVWGQGNRGYAQDRTRKILQKTSRPEDRLLAVARTLSSEGALAAYHRLGEDCRLWGLGPAFGTKYLFFCQPDGQELTALIHDKTVSDWLTTHAGLALSAVRWSASTYRTYLRQMHQWAAELDCRPDEVELCIFRAMAKERRSQWGLV